MSILSASHHQAATPAYHGVDGGIDDRAKAAPFEMRGRLAHAGAMSEADAAGPRVAPRIFAPPHGLPPARQPENLHREKRYAR